MGIKAALSGLFGGAKSAPTYLVQLTPDGFMPAMQFVGSDLARLYTQATWSYVCMRRLAEDVATLPGIVQTLDKKTQQWVEDPSHKLNEVLRKPWGPGPTQPRKGWPWLMEMVSLHHDLTGTALLRKRYDTLMIQSAKRLTALQLLPPPPHTAGIEQSMSHGWPQLAYWSLQGGEAVQPGDAVDITHAHPGSLWRGMSPLVAAERAIIIDYVSHQRIKFNLEQRIGAGMIVKIKGIFSVPDKQRKKTMAGLAETHSTAEQSGLPLVVGDNTEIGGVPEQTMLKDIPEHRLGALREIAGIFSIPLLVLGFADRGEYKDLDLALAGYWTLGLGPKLDNIYNALNQQAIWDLYGPDVRLWYDLSRSPLGLAVLRIQAKAGADLMALGWPAEDVNRRLHLGMPHHGELAVPNMPAVVAGRGQPGRPETEPGQAPDVPDPDEEDDDA